MASDAIALRRRAAAAALGGVLDNARLMEALQLQGELMSGDGVSDVITFIDSVAQRQLIDATACKRLYAALFSALRQPEDALPPDPWPARQPVMQTFAPVQSSSSSPVSIVLSSAAATALSLVGGSGVMAEDPQAASSKPPSTEAAAQLRPGDGPLVFAAILRALVTEISEFHAVALAEISNDAMREVQHSDISDDLRQRFSKAWRRPASDDWKLSGLTLELAELIRVAYVAMAQSFGRAGADQILARAIQAAERLPEARQFSPKRLLSAL